jgi:hypothetical protein
LGEDCSLLYFPEGRQRLVDALQTQFGNGGPIEVEELILVGDIPDSALASTSQVVDHTSDFINTLRSAIDIKKIVYVPGNHDHTLWTEYRELRYGVDSNYITPPGGDPLIANSIRNASNACDNLLTIFFEWPSGTGWSQITPANPFDFVIANPLYAVKTNGRTYIFTHGTHFKSVVTIRRIFKRLVFGFELEEWLVGISVDPDCEVREARNMIELEEEITSFVDSLWPNAGPNATNVSDHLWYLYTVFSSHFGEKRKFVGNHMLFTYPNFNDPYNRINQLNNQTKSIELLEEHFLDHLLSYLTQHGLQSNQLTIVYGDTHDGGFGEPFSGKDYHIYNLGGFKAHHKEDHPPCHLFALQDDGTEHMLDVSFYNLVITRPNIGTKPIIEHAAIDYENRRGTIGWFIRWLLELIGSL